MKDHEIREAINELRDVAIKYRDAQQLRSRIAVIVDSIVEKCKHKEIRQQDLINNKFEYLTNFFKEMVIHAELSYRRIYLDKNEMKELKGAIEESLLKGGNGYS